MTREDLTRSARATRSAVQRSLCWMLLGALTGACSGGDTTTGTPGGGTDTVVASVQLTTAPAALMFVGDSTRLVAAAVNASGAVVSNQAIVWASTVPSVATVSASGLLVATGAGAASISASVAGKQALASVSVVIGATIGAAGGTLSAAGGQFQLTIPSGIVSQPTQFIVRPTATPPADPRVLAASAIVLSPAGISFGASQAQMTLPYDPAGLPSTLAVESLQLYVLDSITWVRVLGSTVNVATRTVSGVVQRTGTYAVRSTPVDQIILSGTAAGGTLYAGDTASIGIKLFTGSNFDSLPRRPINWSSSAPAVVAVDSVGRLRALSVGSATISASTDGKTATTTTTVINRLTSDWSRAEEWSAHGGNAQHSGYVDATVDPSVFRQRWSVVPMSGANLYQVTTGGGGAYANSFARFAGQSVVSVDHTTGATRWRTPFDPATRVAQAAFDEGTLYVQTANGPESYLHSLNAANGTERYRSQYALQSGPWYDGPIVVGSFAMIGSSERLYGFDKITGFQAFSTGTTNSGRWAPAVDNGVAYFIENGVVGTPFTAGAVASRLADARLNVAITPVIAAPGRLVALTIDHMVTVNLTSNTVAWVVDGEFDDLIAAGRGSVYAFESGALVSRSVSAGSRSWSWMPPATCGTRLGLVVTNNVLFVGCENDTYAIDLSTHLPIWTHPVGGYLALSGPQGVLYISKGEVLTAITLR